MSVFTEKGMYRWQNERDKNIMEETGQKPDTIPSSKVDYAAQVRDGLHDIKCLLHLVEASGSTLPVDVWRNSMNAATAKISSSLKKLK